MSREKPEWEGGLRAIAPFYFLGVYFITIVRLDVLDLGSTNA